MSKIGRKNKENNPFVIQEGRLKKGKLEGFSYRTAWTEDSFMPESERGEKVGKTFDTGSLGFKLINLAIFFVLIVLLGRTAWLQIIKGDYYYSIAEVNRIRIERIEAKRGIIYDRELNPLVRNVANFLLYFIPADLPKEKEARDKIIKRVAEILNSPSLEGEQPLKVLSINDIEQILASIEPGSLESYQPLFIADNIEYEKAVLLYLESEYMPGVILSNKTRREYNLAGSEIKGASSLSHILGYTGKINELELGEFGEEYLPIDYIGKTGIEHFWENEMRGKQGQKYIEVDALGKEKKIISTEAQKDGNNLVLSLDSQLQKKLEETIVSHLKKLNLNKASAIIMDPSNGEILALVSLPAYDNNIFARGISLKEYQEIIKQADNPLFNRSISGEYPSGSTIKPVIAASALEEGIITEHTSFYSVGGIGIGQWFFPDWKSGGHGYTSVRKAIAESVNTFFYYIGGGYSAQGGSRDDFVGLGVDRIVNYAKLFGLASQTGIDLVGEASGFLPTKEWKEKTKGERWYIGDTYHLAIGQGDILVTPLQVAVYTAVFANGGDLYRPHLVKQILTGNDNPIMDIEASPVRSDFIDSYNIQVVRQGMRQTVTSGSAQSLQSVAVAVAGKTGTAQWSSKNEPHAWFTGFAPYDNPEIVITILIEEGGDGSRIAVPIAREVLGWYFSRDTNRSE